MTDSSTTVDDFAIARQSPAKGDRDGIRLPDVAAVHRLEVKMRLGAVARVPTAPYLISNPDVVPYSYFDACLLEMRQRDHSQIALDEDPIAGERRPPGRHALTLRKCIS